MTDDTELLRLRNDGYVILERVLGDGELGALKAALAPYEAGRPMGRNDFEGERSQRVYSLAGKGAPFLALVEHPRVLRLLDVLLERNFLLSTIQSIRLHPGETPQAWHTDDAFYPSPRPRGPQGISCIWAIEDFTDDSGATELIPGSHLWGMEHPDDRAHDVVKAVMPAGSVVVFQAGTWHRGGGNASRHQPAVLPALAPLAGVAAADRPTRARAGVLAAHARHAGLQHPPPVPRPGRRDAPAPPRRSGLLDTQDGRPRDRGPRARAAGGGDERQGLSRGRGNPDMPLTP